MYYSILYLELIIRNLQEQKAIAVKSADFGKAVRIKEQEDEKFSEYLKLKSEFENDTSFI